MGGQGTITPSDEALMVAYVGGDSDAFRQLFDRYAPVLHRVMQRGVSDAEVSRELVQQSFVQLHRARFDYHPDRPFRPWLVTIARNIRRDWIRRHIRRPEGYLDDREHIAVEPPRQEQAVEATRLRAAIGTLPAGQREVVELHWLEGLPFGEVAEIVGASRSAVKVRAHRAYKALRALIASGAVTTPTSPANSVDED